MSKKILPPYRAVSPGSAETYGFRQESVLFRVEGREFGQTIHESGKCGLENFDPEGMPLDVHYFFSIDQAEKLFRGDDAIADEASTLKLALLWSSRTSGMRGVSDVILFTVGDSMEKKVLKQSFPSGALRGELRFQPVLFLDCVEREVPGFCGTVGGVLGELADATTLCVDGIGASFPIMEVAEEGAPLWTLWLDWEDPLSDPFAREHVEIRLNKSHPDYSSCVADDNAIPIALKEILTSSLLAFMVRLMEDSASWSRIQRHESSAGSVGDAAWFFISKKEWDVRSPERLLGGIRQTFED